MKLFLLSSFLLCFTLYSQDQSNEILKELGELTKSYETISVTFSISITDPVEGRPSINKAGKAFLKNDKYKLELIDQHTYCDGTDKVVHLVNDKECITSLVEDEDDNSITPVNMLTIWEDNFRSEYKRETTFNEVPVHQIHLYPLNPDDREFHTIVLKIDKEKMQILSVYIKFNDGKRQRIIVKSFTPNKELSDEMFVFDRSKYPEVDCYEE